MPINDFYKEVAPMGQLLIFNQTTPDISHKNRSAI